MYLLSDKSILPSKLLSCLIAFSILLLVSSSLSLLDFNDSSVINKTVLQFITNNNNNNNNTSMNLKPSPEANQQQSPATSPLVPDKTVEKQDITVGNIVPSPTHNPEKTSDKPEKDSQRKCDESWALLRVYMYDLPPQFHFGLLGWNPTTNQTWPNVSDRKSIPSYPGGLNLQHSPEYWLTLDLLASRAENITRACTAARVLNSNGADVIFVPFFSSLSYNRHSKRHEGRKGGEDRALQEKLVELLINGKEWRKSGGRDHVIMAHHPNSMLFARKKLGSCMFVLSDFGRYSAKMANLEKDVIAPYKHVVRAVPDNESATFDERPTLVYFQGAIHRKDGGAIRQELYHLLKDEKNVHFTFGSAQSNGVKDAGKGMAASKFCLNIAGDTPSSNRLFDAIAAHCVPVIISDEIELPFEDVLNYSQFCVFVWAADAVKRGYLLELLRGISREKWTEMWEKLKDVSGHFEYRYPSVPNDAVDMIWQTIARKKTGMAQLNAHRKKRYGRSWI